MTRMHYSLQATAIGETHTTYHKLDLNKSVGPMRAN